MGSLYAYYIKHNFVMKILRTLLILGLMFDLLISDISDLMFYTTIMVTTFSLYNFDSYCILSVGIIAGLIPIYDYLSYNSHSVEGRPRKSPCHVVT